ncbi:S1 RNA-binding domain-containing protein [Tunturiibacter empetritectus]|uniref:S1 RNA-binding domain-containing protein n=1 Tax=Tunturiibacter empetritectus TaxID=3069691 RepID=UPI003D9BB1E7
MELDSLFIEGLVPLTSLQDDRYMFRDTDRQIVGTRNGHVFKMGQRVHVLLDRIDRQQRRLQFALLPAEGEFAPRPPRKSKTTASASAERTHSSPNRSGKKGRTKSKARERNKKSKGKRH